MHANILHKHPTTRPWSTNAATSSITHKFRGSTTLLREGTVAVKAASSIGTHAHGDSEKPSKSRTQSLDTTARASAVQAQPQLAPPSSAARTPLRGVVKEAVSRWFNETCQDALRGDVKQQALLGQMYAEGYGCEKDPAAAKEWIDKSMSRGYRQRGVYCEL